MDLFGHLIDLLALLHGLDVDLLALLNGLDVDLLANLAHGHQVDLLAHEQNLQSKLKIKIIIIYIHT